MISSDMRSVPDLINRTFTTCSSEFNDTMTCFHLFVYCSVNQCRRCLFATTRPLLLYQSAYVAVWCVCLGSTCPSRNLIFRRRRRPMVPRTSAVSCNSLYRRRCRFVTSFPPVDSFLFPTAGPSRQHAPVPALYCFA